MKKTKPRWQLPAIALAVFLSAFNNKEPKNNLESEAWFEYIGNVNGDGHANPLNYEANPSPYCYPGATELCAIYVESDGETTPHPDEIALAAMQTEITAAVGNEGSDDVKLRGTQ